jgi:hypothetical protein
LARTQKATKRSVKKAAPKRSTGGAKKSPKLSAAKKDDLPESSFAFAKQRKEPLIDAKHVRNAIARFMQVEDVSDTERDKAWRRIKTSAKKFDVEISEGSWRELSGKPTAKKM